MSRELVTLALVRHGQSVDNIGNMWAGARTDSPLSALGKSQAEATGAYLKAVAPSLNNIYTSPLTRARDTAIAISNHVGAPIEVMDELIEINFGDLEGMSTSKAISLYPDINSYWGPDVIEPVPGGESAASVAERAQKAFLQIAQSHKSGETVAVVSHQGPITMGLATLLGDKEAFMKYIPSNCGVTWLAFARGFELKELDHTDHLSSIGIESKKWVPR